MTKTTSLATPITAASVGLLAAALLVVVLGVLGVDMSGAGILDVPAAAFAWAWLLLPPVTCTSGIVLAHRARTGRLLAANAAILGLWVLSTGYLMTVHG